MGIPGLQLGTGRATEATKGPDSDKDVVTESNSAPANEETQRAQMLESVIKNETATTANVDREEGTRENDLGTGGKLEPTTRQVETDVANLETNPVQSAMDDRARAAAELANEEGVVRWSSHPIARFTIGRFQFENGLLVLPGIYGKGSIDEFEKIYEELPVNEQTRIKKLDVAEAERVVREMLRNQGTTTQAYDSSTGDRAPNKEVGQGRLEDQNS